MTRVAFLGTPEASVPTLRALASIHQVASVITMPDRPRGRSARPQPPPVKEAAVELGLPVHQPSTRAGTLDALRSSGTVDLGVVVAFGQILDGETLAFPVRGMLNVHFSLLPRWRGAAPVARAIMSGDSMSGVTIIGLDEGLDTGPVLTAQAVDIGLEETAGSLTERLSGLGARLLLDVIEPYVAGDLKPVPQVDDGLTYAHKITAADRPLSPDDEVDTLINKVRGLSPAPGATMSIDGETTKILRVRRSVHSPPKGTWETHEDRPVIGLLGGGVEIVELQASGRKVVKGEDWLRGRRVDRGRIG